MFCTHCGAPAEKNSVFCIQCGALLNPKDDIVEQKASLSKYNTPVFETGLVSANDYGKSTNKKSIAVIIGSMVTITAACVAVIVISLIVLNFTFSSISSENYQELKNGMSYTEVVDILGEPTFEIESSTDIYSEYISSFNNNLDYYAWTNLIGTKLIIVGFENGSVAYKTNFGL